MFSPSSLRHPLSLSASISRSISLASGLKFLSSVYISQYPVRPCSVAANLSIVKFAPCYQEVNKFRFNNIKVSAIPKSRPICSLGGEMAGIGDENPKHTNRLAKEQSPYLLQHAHNPVDWYPWGEEAFAKARTEGKLIFLSVGYSTCHWCHVMEVESFESEEVAELLNKWFVSIKVDREERPDVDKVYMTYVQATQGGGGWPMSVFLTPNLHPVLGGTYFPPEDNYGRIGFKSLLRRVHDVWETKRKELEEGGLDALRQLSAATEVSAAAEKLTQGLADKAIGKCAKQLGGRYDPKLGGFGGAPKFPRPSEINLMLRYYKRLQGKGLMKEKEGQQALDMSLFTLEAMARGGMHDHVGGGFHRYSVDEYWHVPHFEKMLYDQAQLANSYLDAFTITGVSRYALLTRDILDYLRRDMTHPEGGIFSAEDADSLENVTDPRKKEGAYYVWTNDEIEELLGTERAQFFCSHYYVKPGGNCDLSAASDPHHEFRGKNVLIERQSVEETAKKYSKSEYEVMSMLGECRKVLHSARVKRPHPHLDDKVIVSWNGLAISAFARASRILKSEPLDLHYFFPVDGCDPKEYLTVATKAACFIRDKLFDSTTCQLKRSFREKPSAASGFIDDYSFLISGLLDLYEAGGGVEWLDWAVKLQTKQDDLFLDRDGGGYYSVASDDPNILLRMKEDYDGAEPSGNSITISNLLRLSTMVTGDRGEAFRRTGERTAMVFEDRLSKMPLALPQMCVSLDLADAPAKRQIIIAGRKEEEDTEALLNAAWAPFEPHRVLFHIDNQNEGDQQFWGHYNPNVLQMAERDPGDKALAYVCQDFACQAPTGDPNQVEKLLRKTLGEKPTVSSFDIGSILSK